MSEVQKLQKSIRLQNWKIWKNRRKEFKNKFINIQEPVPETFEAEKALSLKPFYQNKMHKVSRKVLINRMVIKVFRVPKPMYIHTSKYLISA